MHANIYMYLSCIVSYCVVLCINTMTNAHFTTATINLSSFCKSSWDYWSSGCRVTSTSGSHCNPGDGTGHCNEAEAKKSNCYKR